MALDPESALRKVRGLLNKAEDPAVGPQEAAAYRAKAEDLMRKYRIEEEQALAQDPQELAPQFTMIDVCPETSEFRQSYVNLFHALVMHVGCRSRYTYAYLPGAEGRSAGYVVTANVVGYEFDLKILNLMYTAARLVFAEYLEPKPDSALSDSENAYRMRKAGIERWKVAEALWNSDRHDGPAHGKVAKFYKAECAKRGEKPTLDGRGISAKLYRESYAAGFVDRMRRRLYLAREGADKLGGAVQLHGRQERVNEAFYARYPEMRPLPETTDRALGSCPACVKRKDGSKCRDHRARRWTQADEARYQRRTSGVARAGRDQGSSAADLVELDGGKPVQRLDTMTGGEREDAADIKRAIGR
jgi:hypothetical protein